MSEFLGIDIKKFDNGGFHFYQTGLIQKVLEITGMENWNGLKTPSKVEAPLGTFANGYETNRYYPNFYASVTVMKLYLALKKRPDISFAVHQYARFTHNTKESHETAVKRICWYLQGTKENGLVLNPSKKMVVDCYVDAYFAGLWRHKNPQDLINDKSRTGFLVLFANRPLLWVSKIQTEIALSTLHSEYVALSHDVIALVPFKNIIKEVINNLVIDSEKLNFLSSSTVCEENIRNIVVATSPTMTYTSDHIAIKFHWFRQHARNEFVIWKIKS